MVDSTTDLQLHAIAHARTGDKGNRLNISLIAYDPALYPLLAAQVTEAAVAKRFAWRKPSSVKRYLLPKMYALNFVLDDVLATGGTAAATLRLFADCGAEVVGISVLAELAGLRGRDQVEGVPVDALLTLP